MPTATPRKRLTLEQCAASYVDDPLGFVLFAYPWGQAGTALAQDDGPDAWQVDVLLALEDALRDEDHAGAIRLAVASGNGVGKGALTAWLVQWFVTTRVKPQIVVTANTKSQLDTKTWREVAKWHGMSRFRHWYTWTKTAYYRTGHGDTWFAAAIPWNEHKPEAFAGTHDKHVLIVADEASILPDTICDAIEGSLTTPGAICVMLGNPTRNSGRFKEIFPGGRLAHRWRTSQVDSRTATHADQELIQQWLADYGLDSDFVRVRVLGQFPRQAVGQFISEETVREAQARTAPVDPLAPTIIGVDVARFGDDRSCIVVRRGGQLLEVKVWRELTTVQLAGYVCEVVDRYRSEHPTVCIDGVGLGAGVVDVCRARGYRVEEVLAGGKALDSQRFFNVRAESWNGMREWLASRGSLPANQDLAIDLCAPEYQYNDKGQLQLERKEHMKARGLASPDCFVAGTVVRTPGGMRAIETLEVGDVVSTPMGARRVLYVWESSTDRLTTVQFSNGASLTGKGKHQVFTWDSGFVRLHALSLTNVIESDNAWRRFLWLCLRKLCTPVKPFGFKHHVDTISQAGKMHQSAFFIDASIQTIMVRFLQGMLCIMAMGIGQITGLRTWNSRPVVHMLRTICVSACTILRIVRARWRPWTTLSRLLVPGISRQKGWPGMPHMASTRGKFESLLRWCVRSVAKTMRPTFPHAPAFVHVPASNTKAINVTRRLLARVCSVAKRLSSINIGSNAVVPVSVQTVTAPESVRVYNLTLDGDNVYYANGVLVANCADALSLTFAVPVAPKSMPRAPQFRMPTGKDSWMA